MTPRLTIQQHERLFRLRAEAVRRILSATSHHERMDAFCDLAVIDFARKP